MTSLREAFDRLTHVLAHIKRPARPAYTILVVCVVHYLNFMDRFGVAGARNELQAYFAIDEDFLGLLQAAFLLAYTVFVLLFGYLGDRYSRHVLLLGGAALWSLAALAEIAMTHYWLFFLSRFFAGIGQAAFSAVAPTVLVDLVSGHRRSMVLAFFYSAVPVGSAFGYLLIRHLTAWTGHWRCGLVVAPLLGLGGAVALIYAIDPQPGVREAAALGASPATHSTVFSKDVVYLARNMAFLMLAGGYTCMCFVTAALGWWTPQLLALLPHALPQNALTTFGVIVAAGGAAGMVLATSLTYWLRLCCYLADPFICSLGLLLGAPLIATALILVNEEGTWVTYGLVFSGQMFLHMNWALAIDILLYVVAHTHRSTALAIVLMVSHALGSCLSPYVVGLISQRCKYECGFVPELEDFQALRLSLISVMLVPIIGAAFFSASSCYIESNRQKASLLLIAY